MNDVVIDLTSDSETGNFALENWQISVQETNTSGIFSVQKLNNCQRYDTVNFNSTQGNRM